MLPDLTVIVKIVRQCESEESADKEESQNFQEIQKIEQIKFSSNKKCSKCGHNCQTTLSEYTAKGMLINFLSTLFGVFFRARLDK